jgi:hypothetical protein
MANMPNERIEGLDHGGRILVERSAMGAIGPLLPKNQPGAVRTDDRRIISGIVHVSEDRLSLTGLPGRLRAFDDGLQSLSSLDGARDLASVV